MKKMRLKKMTNNETDKRIDVGYTCQTLISKDICPTCQHFKSKDVFYEQDERIFYEDDRVQIFLEKYPRAYGHTIIITKDHYEDITSLPLDIGRHVMEIMTITSRVLKAYFNADKVYVVSMCSGEKSHFNVQLIPRLKGERIGGKVFTEERKVLENYQAMIETLRKEMVLNKIN